MLGKCAGGTQVSLYQDLYLIPIHETKWKITIENNEEKNFFLSCKHFHFRLFDDCKRGQTTLENFPHLIFI